MNSNQGSGDAYFFIRQKVKQWKPHSQSTQIEIHKLFLLLKAWFLTHLTVSFRVYNISIKSIMKLNATPMIQIAKSGTTSHRSITFGPASGIFLNLYKCSLWSRDIIPWFKKRMILQVKYINYIIGIIVESFSPKYVHTNN